MTTELEPCPCEGMDFGVRSSHKVRFRRPRVYVGSDPWGWWSYVACSCGYRAPKGPANGSRQEADDAAAELWKALPRHRPSGDAVEVAREIAKNLCRDMYRAGMRTKDGFRGEVWDEIEATVIVPSILTALSRPADDARLRERLSETNDYLLATFGGTSDPDNHELWSDSEAFVEYRKNRDALTGGDDAE